MRNVEERQAMMDRYNPGQEVTNAKLLGKNLPAQQSSADCSNNNADVTGASIFPAIVDPNSKKAQ